MAAETRSAPYDHERLYRNLTWAWTVAQAFCWVGGKRGSGHFAECHGKGFGRTTSTITQVSDSTTTMQTWNVLSRLLRSDAGDCVYYRLQYSANRRKRRATSTQ